VREAAKDVIASGEVTGKSQFETTLLHNPAGLKAKRLLLIGGGKGQEFFRRGVAQTRRRRRPHAERQKHPQLRLRSPETEFGVPHPTRCARSSKAPSSATSIPATTRAIARQDDKEKIDALTIVVQKAKTRSPWKAALQTGRIVAESQNFTRDLVNEPSNLMTPTILAERAKKMARKSAWFAKPTAPTRSKN
jgi:leucyl aminopeptidase